MAKTAAKFAILFIGLVWLAPAFAGSPLVRKEPGIQTLPSGRAMTEDEALAQASAFVKTLKGFDSQADLARARLRATGLTTTAVREFVAPGDFIDVDRFYRVGDRWVVAVSRLTHAMVHKAGQTPPTDDHYLEPSFFEFRVTSVQATGDTVIEIKQVAAPDAVSAQALKSQRLSHVELSLARDLSITSKKYFYRDHEQPVAASFESTHNASMGFDPYPTDLADLDRATRLSGDHVPRVPKILEKYTAKRGVDVKRLIAVESPDLFFRPVRVSWQRGDLWPTYVETPSGFSLLIEQEKQ